MIDQPGLRHLPGARNLLIPVHRGLPFLDDCPLFALHLAAELLKQLGIRRGTHGHLEHRSRSLRCASESLAIGPAGRTAPQAHDASAGLANACISSPTRSRISLSGTSE